jgi:hypothetical protein
MLAMSTLNEPVAKRIATLFRLLSSDFEGEILGAVAAMKRLFAAEGLAFHDIATVIESCNGEIEERKYSDRDAEIIFTRGVEKGRAEQVRTQAGSPEFYDADGHPRWNAIALFCQQNHQRLRPAEQGSSTIWPATRCGMSSAKDRPSGCSASSCAWEGDGNEFLQL